MKRNPRRKITIYLALLISIVLTLMRFYTSDDHFARGSERHYQRCFFKRFLSSFPLISYFQSRSDSRHSPHEGNDNKVIIYWTNVFGNPVLAGDKKWPQFYNGRQCPVKCTLTTDHSMLNKASAIVIHARNIEEMPPQDKIENRNVRWILHSNESPRFAQALTSSQIMSKFNFYLSYRLDSDFPLSLFFKPLLKPLPVAFREKRKTPAVALYSHCETVRTAYLVELMRYLVVDSYGSCLHNTELPENITPRLLPNAAKSSVELYKNYKFTLVFMNSDCDYFVDEKLYYALSAGSVPVFMGTDKIHDFLPGNLRDAIIEVRDFATPKSLASYLKALAKDELAYNRYLRWKYEGYNFPPDYNRSVIGALWDGLPVFCRVCMALNSGNVGQDGLAVETCAPRNLSSWIKQSARDKKRRPPLPMNRI